MKRAKVIKTEYGWEPAYWSEHFKEFVIEPGFAQPTRALAQAALDADLQSSLQIDADQRAYQAGVDHACGYHD